MRPGPRQRSEEDNRVGESIREIELRERVDLMVEI